MFLVKYFTDGVEDDTFQTDDLKEALMLAAEWASEARNDLAYTKSLTEVKVEVAEVTNIATFPVSPST